MSDHASIEAENMPLYAHAQCKHPTTHARAGIRRYRRAPRNARSSGPPAACLSPYQRREAPPVSDPFRVSEGRDARTQGLERERGACVYRYVPRVTASPCQRSLGLSSSAR